MFFTVYKLFYENTLKEILVLDLRTLISKLKLFLSLSLLYVLSLSLTLPYQSRGIDTKTLVRREQVRN